MKKRQKMKRHENISQAKVTKKEKIHVIGIKENIKQARRETIHVTGAS